MVPRDFVLAKGQKLGEIEAVLSAVVLGEIIFSRERLKARSEAQKRLRMPVGGNREVSCLLAT